MCTYEKFDPDRKNLIFDILLIFLLLLTRLTWLIHKSVLPPDWNLYTQNTIFGLKMMVKSGLEKFILKYLHAGR